MRLEVRRANLDGDLRDLFEQYGEQVVAMALALGERGRRGRRGPRCPAMRFPGLELPGASYQPSWPWGELWGFRFTPRKCQ
jgi:hypothetical protein